MTEGLSLDINTLEAKAREISVIDEQLDAASDSATAGKRAIANRLVAENQDAVDSLVGQISDYLGNLDADTLAGVYTGFVKAMNTNYNEKVQSHLVSLADATPSEAVVLSAEAMEELTTERKKLNDQFKALEALLDSFGIDTSSVAKPKKRTGSRGKRGPRAMSQFQFFLNGEELSAAENSLTLIAKRVGGFEGTETEDGKKVSVAVAIKNFLAEQGLDIKDPADEWSFELPSGDTLSAQKFSSEVTDDDDDDGIDDEED